MKEKFRSMTNGYPDARLVGGCSGDRNKITRTLKEINKIPTRTILRLISSSY